MRMVDPNIFILIVNYIVIHVNIFILIYPTICDVINIEHKVSYQKISLHNDPIINIIYYLMLMLSQ